MPVKASKPEIYICFPVTLQFRGTHLPSFKNSKLLTRGKIITKPEYQRVMQQIIRAFESGLRSATQTNDIAIPMVPSAQCSIAWLSRFDDSRFWIPSTTVDCVEVPNGEEGCDLTLEIL